MTVSLVLFDGRRAAERVHYKVLKELYSHLANNPKALGSKKLHFADMPDDVQTQVARQLAGERIVAVINSHWHSSEGEPHEIVFGRHTKMVQLLMYRALELTDGGIEVIIAQRGGWEIYKDSFLAEVRKGAEAFSKRKHVFRTVGYELKPAHTVCGLQLADFYAGAVRKMFLDSLDGLDFELSSPYDQVKHQISLEEFIDIE